MVIYSNERSYMKMNIQIGVAVICGIWILLGHFSRSAGTPFPKCANGTQKCTSLGCTELPINTEEYSSKNVLCINRSMRNDILRPTYRLHGCATEFFSTYNYQSTSGVCTIRTDDNGTDMILAVNEMAPGLHSFSCMVPEAPNEIVTSYAVIVNDTVYRYFRIIINGLLQYYHNSTDVTLDVGSNLTVVVLAVGNVSVINANDPRFICETNFACSHNPDGLSNRYLKCSLHTPAELIDDGRSLLVSIDDNEMLRFSIAVNENSSVSDEGGNKGGSSNDSSILPYIIAGSAVIAVLVMIIICCLYGKCHRLKHIEEGADNDRPMHMGDMLAWLKTKLPRKSFTASSVASQQGSHYSLGQSGE